MPGQEAGSSTPLLDLPPLRSQDGPSLPLVGNMRWDEELQTFHFVLCIHYTLLWGVLWRFHLLCVE